MSTIDGAFIKGKFAACSSDETFPVINPSDGSALYDLPSCGRGEVDQAVQAARDSYEAGQWCDQGASEKKKTLHRFADLVEDNAPTLDLLDAEEMGKPLSLDICTGRQAADFLRFYA
ncbi:MAG: aldehyde dehydrogenase family protein, partial [Gimesia chilikensis]